MPHCCATTPLISQAASRGAAALFAVLRRVLSMHLLAEVHVWLTGGGVHAAGIPVCGDAHVAHGASSLSLSADYPQLFFSPEILKAPCSPPCWIPWSTGKQAEEV